MHHKEKSLQNSATGLILSFPILTFDRKRVILTGETRHSSSDALPQPDQECHPNWQEIASLRSQ